jgi:glutathione S-transferase
MVDKLQLFTSPSAFVNPQRLRIFIHEKGIADRFDERIYDMTPVGEQRGWRHLKMNPWGETPTLVLADGVVIAEADAIARYLDQSFPGRKIMGETALEQGLDTMWNNRIWVHILYRLVTAFHVLYRGLGPKLELTSNPAWGEHCRKEALTHAGLVDRHLSDGREWLLGRAAPSFSDMTLVAAIALSKFPLIATPLDERFEYLDAYWRRWQARPGFRAAYADGRSGVAV